MSVAEFKNGLKVVDSTRAQVLMLIGLYGGTGSGKTVTAILWALGMVGQDGLIGIVDTEQKRSTLAADIVEKLGQKHYGRAIRKPKIVHLDAPFNPLRYVAAIELLIEAGCQAIVVDSMTHAWSGEGGYLDLKEDALYRMAGEDWKKRETCSMAAAARTKPHTHGRLFNAVTHLPVPTILCFRSVEKTRMGKDDRGKTTITKDDYSTPVQESTLIYEMLISGEVTAKDGIGGHCSFRGPGRKHTHPDILSLLPKENEQFSISHGEALARWCANPGASSVGSPPPTGSKAGGGAPPKAPTAASTELPLANKPATEPAKATDKTRSWMLEELIKIHSEQIVTAYAIDKALILPVGELLRDWPLNKVVTSRADLALLLGEIDAWRGK